MTAHDEAAGRYALLRLEVAYYLAQVLDRPQKDLDDIREAICLVKGWEFKP